MLQILKQELYKLVKINKIKTIHINDKLVDARNIDEYYYEFTNEYSDIQISRKYLLLFKDSSLIDHAYHKFVKDKRDFMIIVNEKIKDFDISLHARKQFIRRLFFIVNNDSKNTLKEYIVTTFETYKNDIIKIIKNKDWSNPLIIELMIQFLQNSKFTDTNNFTRNVDRLSFKRRSGRHGKTRTFLYHPFIFIVDDKTSTIMTVELYSQVFDTRTFNAITSDNKRFGYFFHNFISKR